MNQNELSNVYGGAFKITTTFFNAFSRYLTTLKSIGESAGSSLRRLLSKKSCSC